MKNLSGVITRISFMILLLAAGSVNLAAQNRAPTPPEPSFLESYGVFLGITAVIGLIAIAVMLRNRNAARATAVTPKRSDDGIRLKFVGNVAPKERAPKPQVAEKPVAGSAVSPASKTSFALLPVNTFKRLQRTNGFLQLPESHDPDLLAAIEDTNEESEEDAEVRGRALKLLSTFRTANSVTAIAQMALYDLSSKLRADAVSILAELDHESVFETVVTACADPTREVRAAAARGLVKLTFDRAQAWARVVESGDMSRIRHVARCTIEGDLVERSFVRLIHSDRSVAYEAYALTGLLIRSGETEPIFNALADHKDENVKLALLHVLQTIKHEDTFESLSSLLTTYNLSPNIAAKVNEVRSCLQLTYA